METSRRLTYEPSLDGLRAIAVIAVMIYHGFLGWGEGGFLGVDLFFVLSGYLITALLLVEHQTTGTIALGEFWFRRGRRLLPALFAVLGWVAIYATFFAPESQLETLRRDGLSTLLYVANWNFIVSEASYFEQFLSPSPLRHMWSLAIEEQWYLLWPPACVLLLRRWSATSGTVLLAIVGAMGASALAMGIFASGDHDTNRAYYGTDARAQALLAGAALAWLLGRGNAAGRWVRSSGVAVSVAGLVGLSGFVILVLAVSDADRWMYFGGYSLTAILGAALVLGAAVEAPGNVVRSVLSFRPLPFIGRVSYSLYLWHWPMYIFLTSERAHVDGAWLFVARVTLSATAALASYVLIERPVRDAHMSRRELGFGTAVMAGGLTLALVLATNTTARSGSDDTDVALDATRVFVVGDSVYEELVEQFPSATYGHLAVRPGTSLGCGLLPPDDGSRNVHCFDLHAGWDVRLADFDPHIVVVPFSTWDLPDRVVEGVPYRWPDDELRDLVVRQLDRHIEVLGLGRQVDIVILGLPCSRFAAGEEVPNRSERTFWLNDIADAYANSTDRPDVSFIDVGAWACPSGSYESTVDGVQLHRDLVHYTPEAAEAFWAWFVPELESLTGE